MDNKMGLLIGTHCTDNFNTCGNQANQLECASFLDYHSLFMTPGQYCQGSSWGKYWNTYCQLSRQELIFREV